MIEGSAEKTRNGSSIATRTAAALKGIVAGAAKVSGLVDEIAAAANEQAAGLEQVSRGLTQIEQVTAAEYWQCRGKCYRCLTELSNQSAQLKALAGRFQVRCGSMLAGSKVPVVRKAEKSAAGKSRTTSQCGNGSGGG